MATRSKCRTTRIISKVRLKADTTEHGPPEGGHYRRTVRLKADTTDSVVSGFSRTSHVTLSRVTSKTSVEFGGMLPIICDP
jgi:hypothetical protein